MLPQIFFVFVFQTDDGAFCEAHIITVRTFNYEQLSSYDIVLSAKLHDVTVSDVLHVEITDSNDPPQVNRRNNQILLKISKT